MTTGKRSLSSILLALLWSAAAPLRPATATAPSSSPVLLSSTASGLTLRWESPELERASPDELAAAGWLFAGQGDGPALPYATALVVLPPAGAVTLTVNVLAETTRTLSAPLTPQTPPEPMPLGERPQPPPFGVTLTGLGRLRGVRLAQLTFAPLRYDPATLRLTRLDAVEVTLRFAQPPRAAGAIDPFHAALRPLVLNPHLLAGYPQQAPSSQAARTPSPPTAQFRLRTRGLYALSWSTLQAAGVVTATSDPARVRLYRPATATELALLWDAAGQRFLFYADPQPTRWADHETYRAVYGDTPGLRMASYTPETTTLPAGVAWAEAFAGEQHAYDSLYPSPRDGDHWYWRCLERPASAACPSAADFNLTLRTPQTGSPTATLTLWLQGYTDVAANPDHRVAVSVNGIGVGQVTWNGRVGQTAQVTVPSSALRVGANTVRLTLPGLPGVAIEGVWVDALALRYPLAATSSARLRFSGQAEPRCYTVEGLTDALLFDVSNPDAPIRLPPGMPLCDDRPGPHTYFALQPAAIQALTTWSPLAELEEPPGAAYLALAPAALLSTLAPLLDFHAAHGLSTFAASTEAIYDLYGDGRMDPQALRDFIAHAYATWTPRPLYVLLVGDGTWDPLDHLGTGSPTLLPPYLAYVDPWLGEIPVDNRYVAVDGNDNLPDMAVGRLPVNSPAELEAVIAKIVAYSQTPFPGEWNSRHVFVADDPDPAGNFPAEAEGITALVPLTHTVTRLYCSDDPDDPTACANLSQVRAQLVGEWNQGALVLNWVGHSAFQQWEHGRLFHTDDLPALPRVPRYSLLLSMSCFTGHFAHPDPYMTSMDEALVRLPQAGAIAAYGNSGLGLGSSQTPLHRAFYLSALGENPAPPGVAASVAKAAVAGGANRHLVDSYHFFGDPALPLQWQVRPWSAHLYLPLAACRH